MGGGEDKNSDIEERTAVFNFNEFMAAVPNGEEKDNDDVDYVEDEIAFLSGSEEDDNDEDDEELNQFSAELDSLLAWKQPLV